MDADRAALERGIAGGWITARDVGPIASVEPVVSERRVADVIAEDRGE
jgi:hypothetical protein